MNATNPDPRLWRAVVRRDHLTATMSMHTLPAPAALADRIEQIWSLEWHEQMPSTTTGVITHPTVHLTVEAGENGEMRHGQQLPAALVHGPVTRRFAPDLPANGWVVGIHLRPGVAQSMLGRSVHELTDQVFRFDEFPLLQAVDTGPIFAATDAAGRAVAMAAIASATLGTVSTDACRAAELAALIETDSSIASVQDMAARTGLSPRQLQRVCRTHLGLTPRWLLRRARILNAHEMLAEGAPVADIAHRLGWVDQAHFTRDYVDVTGVPPGRHRRTLAADRNCG